jgi:nitroreductase
MDTLEAIFNRRSIRRYSLAHISEEQITVLLKSAMYAPSAVNKQPWHFIVFHEPDTIKKIIDIHPNSSMLSGADVGILVCWDDNLQHDTGYGPVDCAAATQNILLAAHSMGLGAVWVGIYPRKQRMEDIRRIFALPEHVNGFSIISLGFPAEKKVTPERFNKSRIHYEKW